MVFTPTCTIEDEAHEETITKNMNMTASVAAMEDFLKYQFKDKKLLEEALTHSSYSDSASYQRLEFVGDAALGLSVTNFIFLSYPNVDPGQLSLIRAANISTEKLARVAIRHGLCRYVRHNAACLEAKVKEFAVVVQDEDDMVSHGGVIKAPKFLADIVESIAAAVYVDCDFDLKVLWNVFRAVLEPIVTLEDLQQQPQPVTMLFELCQKQGKQLDIKHWRKGSKSIATVYANGNFIASGCSDQRENAKLNAAKEALKKLLQLDATDMKMDGVIEELEIEGSKQKLNELCSKKRWRNPCYKVDKELGPAHKKRFLCSVKIETEDGVYSTPGNVKLRVKDAENSAASMLLRSLQDTKYGLGQVP
ncbi:hypothetical protein HHK36_023883 [Tetracentron sinense]|uniref:Uncharacterized protein n=1 Tax=Tetracentron sinense TaxID=13715 RepID=A0A835D8B4_TETSI|nr:hypothetical protein HHK36_023883 [Tetracentron sinense]